jgi:alpha-galactosidase
MSELEESIRRQADTQRQIILDLMYSVANINEEIKPLEEAKKYATNEIKRHMQLDDLHYLEDPERGVVAKITERKGTPTYDLMTLVSTLDGQDALIKAAAAGMVRIDHAMLSRFLKEAGSTWAAAIDRVKMPGNMTEALSVYMEGK